MSPSAETELAAFAPAKLINLPTLRRTGALIAAANIDPRAVGIDDRDRQDPRRCSKRR